MGKHKRKTFPRYITARAVAAATGVSVRTAGRAIRDVQAEEARLIAAGIDPIAHHRAKFGIVASGQVAVPTTGRATKTKPPKSHKGKSPGLGILEAASSGTGAAARPISLSVRPQPSDSPYCGKRSRCRTHNWREALLDPYSCAGVVGAGGSGSCGQAGSVSLCLRARGGGRMIVRCPGERDLESMKLSPTLAWLLRGGEDQPWEPSNGIPEGPLDDENGAPEVPASPGGSIRPQ